MERRIFSSVRQILAEEPPHIPGASPSMLSSVLRFLLESTSISMVSGKRRNPADTYKNKYIIVKPKSKS